MRDQNKTKDQLIRELNDLRQKVSELQSYKSETALKLSEKRYRQLVEAMNEGL